jgi:hypothetical protein
MLGNRGPEAHSVRWWLDTIGPSATIDSGPSGLTNDNTPTFTFSAPFGDEEHDYSWTCAVDGYEAPPMGNTSECRGTSENAGAITWTALVDGTYRFSVEPRDAAGNVGARVERVFTVDTRKPVVTFASSSPAGKLAFGADEQQATFTCAVDGGAPVACDGEFDISSLGEGTHTIEVRAKDLAGNVSDAATRTVAVQRPVQDQPKGDTPPAPVSGGGSSSSGGAAPQGAAPAPAVASPPATGAPRTTVVAPAKKTPAAKKNAKCKRVPLRKGSKRTKLVCKKPAKKARKKAAARKGR